MSFSRGLSFQKFDFHVHTPGSRDYKVKNVKPIDIVNSALSKGLSGIAITDHQSGKWIDMVKTAAKGKNLVIFPGLELKVSGGKEGIHLNILFDVDKGTGHITQFLNTLGIYEKEGKVPSIADMTVTQVAHYLRKFDDSAIIILAHCLSNKGVISDMRGEQRVAVFKPNIRNLLGAEAPESDFLNVKKQKDKDRVIDLLDGGFKDYYHKRMGVFQSSDAHSSSEIGKKFTYLKVDDEVTIEDIRQGLIDRDTRIRQSFEYKVKKYPYIESLSITSGFLADQKFEFHEGLNSILGAKGSGKSLAVEFLRFALSQQPTIGELLMDHEAKLEKKLQLHGEVSVIFSDETGRKYQINRTYNPADGNPTEIIDKSTNTKKDLDLSQIFPIMFLSQNEIIRIAENTNSQREFIDKFFDFRNYQREIEKRAEELKKIDQRFSEIISARIKEVEIEKKTKTNLEEIGKINRQIKNEVFEEYSRKESVGQSLKIHIGFLDSLIDSLKESQSEYRDLSVPEIEAKSDPSVKRASDLVKNALEDVKVSVDNQINKTLGKKETLKKEYSDWELGFRTIREKYTEVVKKAGGDQALLNQRRKILVDELSRFQAELTKYKAKSQQIKSITDMRNRAIEKLETAHKVYYQERKKRCEHFTKSSLSSLEVSIKEREDKTKFGENLMRFKKGSWLKDEEIETITKNTDPKDFIDSILRFEWSERKAKRPLEVISKATGIETDNLEKLFLHLLNEYTYPEILSIFYTSIPNDVPSIKYKVGNDFKNLEDLSVGQKSVALLIIALSDGNFPIIIDQPEDSLDLRSIWEDLCKKLRGSKEKRQFIFTTHNSSVAVASDTDKFTILQANASRGEVLFTGSMNRSVVREEVLNYLEGGYDTYLKKSLKYIRP